MSNSHTTPLNTWGDTPDLKVAPVKKARQRRRMFIVDPELQLRLLGEVFFVLLVGAILALVSFHVIDTLAFSMNGAFADFPSERLMVWSYVGVSAALNIAVIVIISTFYSHRIAGPSYRIVRALDELASGDLSTPVRLRKKDHLKRIAGAVNDTREAWAQSVGDIRSAVEALKAHPEPLDRAAIEHQLAEIEAVLERYTVGSERPSESG